ncbi:MAG: PilZ domain-containing protein [Thiomicrorhabdus sp.]|jgi:hypothetical protein|nr:PilZ domain-containing protein [Thiomicrorhabdus sp.]
MPKNVINQLVKTNRKIILIGKNGQAEGQLVDLSLTEAGVLTKRGAQEGTDLELVFEVPALEDFITLHINATVIHRHNSENLIYLKLSFARLNEFDSLALADFVDYKTRLLQLGQNKY